MNSALFSPKVLFTLIAAITITFALSILLSFQGEETGRGTDSIGANTYSHSAVGHAAFLEVLKRQGRVVQQAQQDVLDQTGSRGLLVLAEPDRNLASEELHAKLQRARNILLVLPKWQGTRSNDRRDWIGSAHLLPLSLPEAVLALVTGDGEIVRVDTTKAYKPSLLDHDPHLDGTRQLIAKSKLIPLIGTPDGILLGQIIDGNRRILVLSDPDIIENHGIGKYSNAALAVDIVDVLAKGNVQIVIDETIHGFATVVKPPLQLFTGFPYNIVAIQALVGLGLMLLATTARFGVPQLLAPSLGAGKRGLIANSALLIDFGGHHAALLQRYLHASLRDTARQLRAPRGLEGLELMAWLDKASQARGLAQNASGLIGQAENAPAKNLPKQFAAARALYFWKREMLHGPQGR